MADGTIKAISEIEIGDYVLAEDSQTGERGPRKVTHLWEHEDTVVDLEIDGDLVTTTEDHPFWNATDGRWEEAQDLDVGDLVRTADGQLVAVGGLKLRSARTTTAFNLTVDGIHTNFVAVGEDQILVHNTCSPANLGRTYGNRTVVENPNIKKTGFRGSANPADPFHGLNRAIERGVRPADILETMRSRLLFSSKVSATRICRTQVLWSCERTARSSRSGMPLSTMHRICKSFRTR